jgi:iron-sulfur cluster repair protein YtfE (RIC family)
METESLAAALQREHEEIDEGIAEYAVSPGSLAPLVRTIRALRRHIYLEEEFLFPMLGRAEPTLMADLLVMLREHARIWATLDELEREVEEGKGTGLVLCRQLTVQLLHHNRTEETVLYPVTDEALPAAVAERLLAFLDTGEMPQGWVCLRARP